MNNLNQEKEVFLFKTNINCSGCVEKISPVLDSHKNILKWTADTASKDKILEVVSKGIQADEIITAVQKAGFKIEILK